MILQEKSNFIKKTHPAFHGGGEAEVEVVGESYEKDSNFKWPNGEVKKQVIVPTNLGELGLNNTNKNLLVAALGKDTAKWIGKKFRLTLGKTFSGKDMFVVKI
jgi:hypothetical protein